MYFKSKRLRSQPRIQGIKRIVKSTGLHPDVEYGLESIARLERRSVSWVKADIISKFFGIDAATGTFLKERK